MIGKEGRITVEEMAKIVSEKTYWNLCKQCEPGTNPRYSLEEYWKRKKEYFTEQAKTYLAVKECLEAK